MSDETPNRDERICGNPGNTMSTCQRRGCQSFGTGEYKNGILRSGCAYWADPNGVHVGVATSCECACRACIILLKLVQPEQEYPVKPDQ